MEEGMAITPEATTSDKKSLITGATLVAPAMVYRFCSTVCN